MSSDVVVNAEGLGKSFLIYAKPEDRLKQMLWRKRRKLFTEYWAFQNVDLKIKRGEAVALVGRNGSGKSTLLQVITGTLQPTTGHLAVTGRIAPLLELGAGFNPEFTGMENVRLAASILGLSSDEIEARIPSILDFAAIGDFVDQPVKSYSSGMYARLAFAVSAHVDADILIVDEILSVGDAAFGQKCMRYIRRFREHGTLILVSHDQSSVNALCDRAVWLDRGKVRADGPAADVGFQYQAALRNELDGGGFAIGERRRQAAIKTSNVPHVAHQRIKASDKRNLLEVFAFNESSPAFGTGGAQITKVTLEEDGVGSASLEGGEDVVLTVDVAFDQECASPIVGFYVRDRTGQNLFGDNTFLTYSDSALGAQAGDTVKARFAFRMPYLPSGDYAVTVAVADGDARDHVTRHWLDEALIFRVSTSPLRVGAGIVGIPMHAIEMQLDRNTP